MGWADPCEPVCSAHAHGDSGESWRDTSLKFVLSCPGRLGELPRRGTSVTCSWSPGVRLRGLSDVTCSPEAGGSWRSAVFAHPARLVYVVSCINEMSFTVCSFKCLFYIKKKKPGLAHRLGNQRGARRPPLQVKRCQVVWRRPLLAALLESDINRSKFTRREKKISGQHRLMKRAVKIFFFFLHL